MIKDYNQITVPKEEKLWITPNMRQKCFDEIYNGYLRRYPQLKLAYAYLNFNPEEDDKTDYCVIYRTRNDDDTMDLILFDIVPAYSDRCTPAYRYYRKVKKEDNFFRYGINDMHIMIKPKFYEYLESGLSLSKDKNHAKYWRKPEFAPLVCKELFVLALRDQKNKPQGENPEANQKK